MLISLYVYLLYVEEDDVNFNFNLFFFDYNFAFLTPSAVTFLVVVVIFIFPVGIYAIMRLLETFQTRKNPYRRPKINIPHRRRLHFK